MAAIEEEKYVFSSQTKTRLIIVGIIGIVVFILGVVLSMNDSGHHEGGGGEHHGTAAVGKTMVASTDVAAERSSAEASGEGVAQQQEEHAAAGGEEHHGSPTWLKRIYASLWHNTVFFTGLGIIGLFFVAVQFAAQAGWSAPINRIPLAMGSWIPIAGITMLVLWFIAKGDLFHWTHASLYAEGTPGYDKILAGKSGLWYWPLEAGSFPIFYILRMILFFVLWYLFLVWIRREMLAEDIAGGIGNWLKARKLSAVFLIIFAVSSSVGAWDWVMGIEPHWFSTMMGWYVFASWWVTGLAMITLIVAFLKEAGYLKMVTANHLHDLGKFIFAFSIFWTYIWFSQFMLIYYANIPEETVYFIARMKTPPFSWIFFANLILNFVLPFLLFMTRDAKRHLATLKLVCPIVIVGHWLDFYNMITPGVMKTEGAFGLVEIGLVVVFMALFLFVTLTSLASRPLVAKNNPMMAEALNHHI